jgi:hypothetical protein
MDRKGYIYDSGLHISSKEAKYEEYVSEISKFPNRNYDLGPVASKMLMLFVNRPYISTYQIFTILKRRGEADEMAYKNVHKRIKQLHSLNLIEKVEKQSIQNILEESIHNPTFYRLTTGGIFHLIYKDKFSLSRTLGTKKMFQNYGENIIFKTLLYPYFEKETLSKINMLMIFTEILNYLNECCAFTNDIVEFTKKKYGPVVMPLFNLDNPEEYDVGTMLCLDNEFHLGFTEKLRIKKIDNDQTIKISSKNKSAIIKLNERKDTATLITQDKKTYELGVEAFDGKYEVGMKIGTYKEGAFKQLVHSINYSLLTLAISIIMRITKKDFEGLAGVDIVSFKTLSHDHKLMSLLERTKKIFEERYETLIQLKNET